MNVSELDIPILQAPIAGADTVELAAAISNAGGMGSLAMTWVEPHVASRMIARLQTATSAPFFVNFVLAFPPRVFETVVDLGVPAVTLSWGQNAGLIEHAHRNNIAAGVQVGSAEGAQRAIGDGADFVICQGIEAGGHVQSTTPLASLLPQVVELAKGVPIVAAGGLVDSDDIRWVLEQGASAVMLGTRFVATVESGAHPLYKAAVVEAKAGDTSYTLCFDGDWPYAAHRVIRNRILNEWEAAGCPPHGARPGEADVVGRAPSGEEICRYSSDTPTAKISGDAEDWCLYAGASVGKITDIPSATELMRRLWSGVVSR